MVFSRGVDLVSECTSPFPQCENPRRLLTGRIGGAGLICRPASPLDIGLVVADRSGRSSELLPAVYSSWRVYHDPTVPLIWTHESTPHARISVHYFRSVSVSSQSRIGNSLLIQDPPPPIVKDQVGHPLPAHSSIDDSIFTPNQSRRILHPRYRPSSRTFPVSSGPLLAMPTPTPPMRGTRRPRKRYDVGLRLHPHLTGVCVRWAGGPRVHWREQEAGVEHRYPSSLGGSWLSRGGGRGRCWRGRSDETKREAEKAIQFW